MLQSTLVEKPSKRLFLKGERALALTFTITLLAFSALTCLVAAGYLAETGSPNPAAQPSASLLCLLVVAGGSFILLAGWRFSLLRLKLWQIVLIVFGAGVGLALSLQHLAYKATCCMVAYMVGYGYPFTAIKYSIAPDNPLSWHQVFTLIQQHSNQVYQELAWHSIIADTILYAHITLAVVILLRVLFFLPGYFIKRKGKHAL